MFGLHVDDTYDKHSEEDLVTYPYSTVIFLIFGIESPILCESVCYRNQRVNKRYFLHIAGFNEVG